MRYTHMGLTRYQRAIKVLKKYVEDSGRNYIWTMDLRGLIIRGIGSTENTVVQTLQMLREQGIIKEGPVNKWKIKI